jgi:hypothetical protein
MEVGREKKLCVWKLKFCVICEESQKVNTILLAFFKTHEQMKKYFMECFKKISRPFATQRRNSRNFLTFHWLRRERQNMKIDF